MKWIIEKANQIRERYGLDDLVLVAEKLGAEVVELPLGKIIKEAYFKDEKVIVVDPNLHPYKKRHLIAHGLAHHVLHRKRRVNYFREEKDSIKGYLNHVKLKKQEREAEVFAAYYLIPEEKLSQILKMEWVQDSPAPIPDLAEEFQVSENFMRKRLDFRNSSK